MNKVWYVDVSVNDERKIKGEWFADGDRPNLTKRDAVYLLQSLIKEDKVDVLDYDNMTMTIELYYTSEGRELGNSVKSYKLF